jgi:hypothetical protein
MSKSGGRQRTIRIVDFELPRGAITVERLMDMPRADWDHLRAEINLRRLDDPTKPLARCRLCEEPVFIRSQATEAGHVPMFVHYPESPRDCPWFEGGNLTQDAARAAQYQGQQESALHRRICVTIAELAKADPRCSEPVIDTYLRPAIHARGRWPDVYFEMEGAGRFALEVQLSKPFAPEIAARHLHYDREGISLVWIFNELECPMPQGFHDVVTMQRGNAFLFDADAEAASLERGTLVLSCYIEDGKGGWLPPRLVTLDDLDRSSGRSAFVEDRRSALLEARCRAARDQWWKALQAARREKKDQADWSPYSEAFANPWASLIASIPGLAGWEAEFWARRSDRARAHVAALFAILCSVAHSAEKGAPTLHITRITGENAVLQMLNSKLPSSDFRHCARLIKAFVGRTPLKPLLDVASLRKIVATAEGSEVQIESEHPLWLAMAHLFPEILDGMVRAELQDLKRLPKWAKVGLQRQSGTGADCLAALL